MEAKQREDISATCFPHLQPECGPVTNGNLPRMTWDWTERETLSPSSTVPLLPLQSCFSLARPRIQAVGWALNSLGTAFPGLNSLEKSVTWGLWTKSLLYTHNLIAAINTNYVSLSIKLRRVGFGDFCSISGWRTNGMAIFNLGNVSGERDQLTLARLSPPLQTEVFHFQVNVLSSAQGVE